MDLNKYVKDTGRIVKTDNSGGSFVVMHKNHGCLARSRSYGIETISSGGREIQSLCFYNIRRLRDAEKIYKWVLRAIEINRKDVAL